MGKIQVLINPDGSIITKVEGIKGTSCKELTKGLEKKLGKVIQDKETEEYREVEVSNYNENNQNF